MAEAIKELSESQTYNVLQKAIRSKVPHQINIDGPMWTALNGPYDWGSNFIWSRI